MNRKFTKRLPVLAAVLLALCLPTLGVAEYVDFSSETLAAIGIPRRISPMLNQTAYDMFYRDYDNDGEITVDELNLNVKMSVNADEGISVNKIGEFAIWTDPADGQDYIDYPVFVYEVTSQKAEGKMIVATITNTQGDIYEHKLTVELKDLVRKNVRIEATPIGTLQEDSYGNYELDIEEGATLTITPEYEW